MAIQQTKKLSDLEKRLKLLRQQVYGRDLINQQVNKSAGQLKQRPSINTTLSGISITSDIQYLHQDLIKIFVLAGLAIGVQLILFFLTRNHILNLNFF